MYDFTRPPALLHGHDGSGVVGFYSEPAQVKGLLAAASVLSFADWRRQILACQSHRRVSSRMPFAIGSFAEQFVIGAEVIDKWMQGDGSGTAVIARVVSFDARVTDEKIPDDLLIVTRGELERGMSRRRAWGACAPARVYLTDGTITCVDRADAAGQAWLRSFTKSSEADTYCEAMLALLNVTESRPIFESNAFRNPNHYACGDGEWIYPRAFFKELQTYAEQADANLSGLFERWQTGLALRRTTAPVPADFNAYVIVPGVVVAKLFRLLNAEVNKRHEAKAAAEVERLLSARFDANRGHARKALHNAADKLRVLSDNVPASNRQQVYRNQIKELMQQLADISTHVLNMDPFRA